MSSHTPEDQSDLTPTLKQFQSGYTCLVNTLIHNGDKQAMAEVIENMVAINDPHQLALNYFHTLIGQLNQYCCLGSAKEIRFTCAMDWKAPVGDFVWNLQIALSDVANDLVLPSKDDYPNTASILYEGVLDDFRDALAKKDIVLDAMDDGSDAYQFILYHCQDSDRVRQAIAQIGLSQGIAD